MDIVTIQLEGYGCEVTRGKITEKDYKFLKNLDNLWVKNLRQHLKKYISINKETHNYGILKGDICIKVNDDIVLDLPISILDTQDNVVYIEENKINSSSIVVTTLQHMEGVVSDTTFLLDGEFNINKLVFIKKHIKDNVDNNLVDGLLCQVYYDGIEIPLSNGITDLRMSELFFNKPNEKNHYR